MKKFLIGLVLLVAAFPALLLYGWAFAKLWAWFVTPVFGLPAIGIAESIGLCLILRFATIEYNNNSKEKETKYGIIVAQKYLGPLLALGFGYIVKCWM